MHSIHLPLQAMSGTAEFIGTNTGWEWALISDMANQAEKEKALADPDRWTRAPCDESGEAMVGWLEGHDDSKNPFVVWFEKDDGGYIYCVCRWPEPCGQGLWAFHAQELLKRWLGPCPRVLVRAIPTARLLVASLSETPSAIEIIFRNLAGDQVGETTRSKDEGTFLMEDLIELAEEVAEQEDLLTSVNQEVRVLLDGCHHQLPLGAVLWSAGANQERNFAHV